MAATSVSPSAELSTERLDLHKKVKSGRSPSSLQSIRVLLEVRLPQTITDHSQMLMLLNSLKIIKKNIYIKLPSLLGQPWGFL